LDLRSKENIATVTYVRGFKDPLEGDIEKIFLALKEKLRDAGSWPDKR
jgi:hypothetical protein